MKTTLKHKLNNLTNNVCQQNLETQIEEISQSLLEDQQQRRWVDWVKEFGNRIDKLKDPDFTIEDRKKFLEGVVNKILVTNNDVREHELKIEFRLPYVGDKFEYNDPSNKSKGYTIKKGRKIKKVVTDLLKKTIG